MPLDCLYTTVVNLGAARAIGYLGKHGKRLEAGETFTQPGDLVTLVAKHRRKFASLEKDLDEGRLAIVKTPSVHLYDASRDETKAVQLVGGTLGVADACWGAYSSSV